MTFAMGRVPHAGSWHNTFLFCSPLTLWRSCFSLNFCPCLPATFKTSSLSCYCLFLASSSPTLLSSILPQAFFSFLLLSKSTSLLLITPHPTPPPLFTGMAAELEALLLQEPNSSWLNLGWKNHGGQVAGPGHPPRHRIRGKVIMKTTPEETRPLRGTESQERGTLPRIPGPGRGRGLQGPRR